MYSQRQGPSRTETSGHDSEAVLTYLLQNWQWEALGVFGEAELIHDAEGYVREQRALEASSLKAPAVHYKMSSALISLMRI